MFSPLGILEIAFAYLLEMVGGDYKTLVGIGANGFWVTGWMILALLAYFIKNWRHLLLITSLPGLLGVSTELNLVTVFNDDTFHF